MFISLHNDSIDNPSCSLSDVFDLWRKVYWLSPDQILNPFDCFLVWGLSSETWAAFEVSIVVDLFLVDFAFWFSDWFLPWSLFNDHSRCSNLLFFWFLKLLQNDFSFLALLSLFELDFRLQNHFLSWRKDRGVSAWNLLLRLDAYTNLLNWIVSSEFPHFSLHPKCLFSDRTDSLLLSDHTQLQVLLWKLPLLDYWRKSTILKSRSIHLQNELFS